MVRRRRAAGVPVDSFVVLKFLIAALLPPASTVLGVLSGGGLALAGWRRTGALVGGLAVLEAIMLSLPPVADALVAPLEAEARAAAQQARSCCYSAIVLLGGGMAPAYPPLVPQPHLADGADRVWEAARLFHRGTAPKIIASGGRPDATAVQSEAEAMRALLLDLGVPASAIVVEDRSRNTIENLRFVRELAGGERVALVTSGYHMARALRLARRFGVEAAAFPTDWQAPMIARPAWERWLPTLTAELSATRALREHLAALFDWR